MYSISDRMKKIIGAWIPQRGRFKTLEKMSGIPSDHWKNFWHGKQRAQEFMIQAIARAWPEYSLWLVTGIYENENGQICPPERVNDLLSRSIEAQILLRKIEIDERYNLTNLLSLGTDESISKLEIEKIGSKMYKYYIDKVLQGTDEECTEFLNYDEEKFDEILKLDSVIIDLRNKLLIKKLGQ